MTYKYGEFSPQQTAEYKEKMRKQIFFLLLIVDPKTKDDYKDVNVEEAFDNVLHTFGGFNDLIGCPMPMVTILSMLNAARLETQKEEFEFSVYRKLILDAGSEVLKIKEEVE